MGLEPPPDPGIPENLAANQPCFLAMPPPLSEANPDAMPNELVQQLSELEKWAIGNRDDARRDAIAFWSLKIPAILASASAGVLAHFNLTFVGVIAGAVASICIVIDGINPRGMLRNVHLRAYHDIRMLSSHMMSLWRGRSDSVNSEKTGRQIIRDSENERQRIARYIRDAETALNYKGHA